MVRLLPTFGYCRSQDTAKAGARNTNNCRGLLFILIQIGGTLITRMMGNSGMIVTAFFGGLVSSASTTAAAATMAMHGQISANIAGSAAIISYGKCHD